VGNENTVDVETFVLKRLLQINLAKEMVLSSIEVQIEVSAQSSRYEKISIYASSDFSDVLCLYFYVRFL
jgi:hypothetical protein